MVLYIYCNIYIKYFTLHVLGVHSWCAWPWSSESLSPTKWDRFWTVKETRQKTNGWVISLNYISIRLLPKKLRLRRRGFVSRVSGPCLQPLCCWGGSLYHPILCGSSVVAGPCWVLLTTSVQRWCVQSQNQTFSSQRLWRLGQNVQMPPPVTRVLATFQTWQIGSGTPGVTPLPFWRVTSISNCFRSFIFHFGESPAEDGECKSFLSSSVQIIWCHAQSFSSMFLLYLYLGKGKLHCLQFYSHCQLFFWKNS